LQYSIEREKGKEGESKTEKKELKDGKNEENEEKNNEMMDSPARRKEEVPVIKGETIPEKGKNQAVKVKIDAESQTD
jgi:hypothetical protein